MQVGGTPPSRKEEEASRGESWLLPPRYVTLPPLLLSRPRSHPYRQLSLYPYFYFSLPRFLFPETKRGYALTEPPITPAPPS